MEAGEVADRLQGDCGFELIAEAGEPGAVPIDEGKEVFLGTIGEAE